MSISPNDVTTNQTNKPVETKRQLKARLKQEKKEARQQEKLAKQQQAANNEDSANTSTDKPDSFYERAIEWTHGADKVINLFLGYALAIASVLGFMDVLSNGQILSSVPYLFFAWLAIMGLGVDFQILLVIGRIPDLVRMPIGTKQKWVIFGFNLGFLIFLGVMSVYIGAIFTQHRDMTPDSTIGQAMNVLNIDSTLFVYGRAALATLLLVLMGVDRTMERWRMQVQGKQGGKQNTTKVEEETPVQVPQPVPAGNAVNMGELLQTILTMNQQNLQAVAEMNRQTMQESVNRFQQVTIELVRETVNRSKATIALPGEVNTIPQIAQEASIDTSELPVITIGEKPERGKQDGKQIDYAPLIEQMYLKNPAITTVDIEQELGCTRKTASKHLQRLRPMEVNIGVNIEDTQA